MLGIVKDSVFGWRHSLRLLPSELLLILTFGYLTVQNFKIKKVSVPLGACFVHFGDNLITVLTFGYFSTNWVVRYWNARYR